LCCEVAGQSGQWHAPALSTLQSEMLFGDPNYKLCERTLRSQLSLRAQVAWQAYRQRRLLRGGRANVLAGRTATAPFVASKRAKDPSPALTQSSHCRTKKLGLFFQLLLHAGETTHTHTHTHTHGHTHTHNQRALATTFRDIPATTKSSHKRLQMF
jgi:hypothetical protein